MKDDSKDKLSISRRKFFQGAGIAALAVGGASALSGCTSSSSSSSSTATASAANAASSTSSSASTGAKRIMDRNPNTQIEESVYGEQTKELTSLFSEIKVGTKTLKNRIVKSGAGCPVTYDDKGFPNEQMLAFYESIAKGGAGYIIIDNNDMPVDALKEVADRVQKYGAAIGMQRYSMANWMPAAMGGMSSSSTAVQLGSLDFSTAGATMATTDQVKAVIQDFVSSAKRGKDAGFDGFEINAGCNHFLDSFLSRVYNNERTDEYGPQSLENRARIITDIISGVRGQCGDDMVISVLFNAFEVNFDQLGDDESCIHIEEAIEFAKLFEKAGADMLHVRWATHGNHAASFFPDRMFICEPGNTGYGSMVDFTDGEMDDIEYQYQGAAAFSKVAGKIKKEVSIPVGTVGCMDPRLCPDVIESSLEDGDIDLVMMTRPLMADPDLPNKLQDGKRDEIAPCTHCESCFMSTPGGCRVNPLFSRAGTDEIPEGYTYTQTTSPKNVMVIGGGPAGMEAARASAYCGNKVTLYEKTGVLGGKMLFAEMVKGEHEHLGDYIDYLSHQLDIAGVDVKLGTEVTADVVSKESPDIVIIANGADYVSPDYEGFSSSKIAATIESSTSAEDSNVVLLGSGVQVLNIAEYLLKNGNHVTIVNPGPAAALGTYMPEYIQGPTLNWMRYHGLKDYNGVTIEKVTDSSVAFTTAYGMEVEVPADHVYVADEAADTDFQSQIKAVAKDVILVGDAFKPANIIYATKVAHTAGRYLTQPEFPVASAVGFPGGSADSASQGGSSQAAASAGAAPAGAA